MRLEKQKIRIGLVGCGKIAANHLQTIRELENQFELHAVCDSNANTLQTVTRDFEVTGFSDLTTMLKSKPELDIVTLCSPSGLHAKQTIQIANAGKHIITEKPMATRWVDGIDMVNACDEANVRLFVVKQLRYQPALQLLKRAIKNKRFGRIYLVNLNVFWTRPQSYYEQARWRGTWEFDGGAFMNQASHYVDLLQWLFGPVQNVQAMMSTLAIDMEAEDTGVLNIRWRSGTLGSMNVTMLTYPKNFEASLTVLGEHGSVKLGGLAANQIEHWQFAQADEEDSLANNLKNAPQFAANHCHKCYYENVAKTLHGETHADTDGREGLRSLEILTASYISARDNKTVALPLIY